MRKWFEWVLFGFYLVRPTTTPTPTHPTQPLGNATQRYTTLRNATQRNTAGPQFGSGRLQPCSGAVRIAKGGLARECDR